MLSNTIEINVEFDEYGRPIATLVGVDGDYSTHEIAENDTEFENITKRTLDDVKSTNKKGNERCQRQEL